MPLSTHAYLSYSIQDHGMFLWQERMDYSREQNLEHLAIILTRIERCLDLCFCKPCVYDGMKKTPHKILAKRSDFPIEYIHTDITGPLPVAGYDRFYH